MSREKSHAVPAASSASVRPSASVTLIVLPLPSYADSGLPSLAFFMPLKESPASAAASSTERTRLWIAL